MKNKALSFSFWVVLYGGPTCPLRFGLAKQAQPAQLSGRLALHSRGSPSSQLASCPWGHGPWPPPAARRGSGGASVHDGKWQAPGGGESTGGLGRGAAGRVAGAGAQPIPQMASLLRLPSPLCPSMPLLRRRLPAARPPASTSRGQARYESVKVGHCSVSCFLVPLQYCHVSSFL